MPLIKQHSPGNWKNEENILVRLNRKLITGGPIYETHTEIYISDEKVGDEDPVGYTVYTISSRNSYDIEKVRKMRPAFTEDEVEVSEYLEELFITEEMYPYFVYLVPGKIIALEQVPFTEWYKTEGK